MQNPKVRVFPFKSDPEKAAEQINQWASEADVQIVSVRVGQTAQLSFFTVLYRDGEKPAVVDDPFRGNVISVVVERVSGDDTRPDFCMAGVFPVPENYSIHPEDPDPAPPPLLSPRFDPKPYKDWFFWPGRLEN